MAQAMESVTPRREPRVFDTDEEVFDALDAWIGERWDREFKVRSNGEIGRRARKICMLVEGVEVVATGRSHRTGDAVVAALKQWDEKNNGND